MSDSVLGEPEDNPPPFINQQYLLKHTHFCTWWLIRKVFWRNKTKRWRYFFIHYLLVQIKCLYLNKIKLFICFNKNKFCTEFQFIILFCSGLTPTADLALLRHICKSLFARRWNPTLVHASTRLAVVISVTGVTRLHTYINYITCPLAPSSYYNFLINRPTCLDDRRFNCTYFLCIIWTWT